MERQRSELVPIGDALSGMGGPVAAIRDATPQALHHFTQADQVNQLVAASEADPNRGFMARMMALCSLPRTKALLHDSTAARVGALFQLLVQDTTAQDCGLPSSAIRLRM